MQRHVHPWCRAATARYSHSLHDHWHKAREARWAFDVFPSRTDFFCVSSQWLGKKVLEMQKAPQNTKPSYIEGQPPAKQLWWRGPSSPSEQPAEHQAAECPSTKKARGCIRQSTTSRSTEVILLLSITKATYGLPGPVLGPPVQERYGHTEESPKGHQDDQGLMHLCNEKRTRELGLFSLEQRRLMGLIYSL